MANYTRFSGNTQINLALLRLPVSVLRRVRLVVGVSGPISGRVPTCDSTTSQCCPTYWEIKTLALWSHYPYIELTSPCPILLMPNNSLGGKNINCVRHWFDLIGNQSQTPTRMAHNLPIRRRRLVLN